MTGDDRIRDAFRDLNDRVARDINPAIEPSARVETTPPRRSGMLGRPALAIAGLVVVAGTAAAAIGLAGGDDGQQVATDSTEVSTGAEPDDVTASTIEDPTDDGTGSADASTDDEPDDAGTGGDAELATGLRFRVATELVAADAADPFLNVRGDPDARADLVAKLPAIYTGLLATGRNETAADGGTWIEVELLHPVAVAEFALDDDRRRPTGWVNLAFVELLADGVSVGTDELPACQRGADSFGIQNGTLDSGHVAAIESAFLTDTCLRVVLTFGAGTAPIDWIDLPDAAGPVAEVPNVLNTIGGGYGSTVDLGSIASTWPGATETDGVYLVRGDDRGLDLVIPTPADVAAVAAAPDIGAIVVDLRITGDPPPSGAGVVLSAPAMVGIGTIQVSGFARPFEAVLGASIEDQRSRPVEAVWSGNAALGTRLGAEYGVAATDWVETWGAFALRAEGLAVGDYTLVLDAEGAGETPEVFRLPFTITESGERPTLASAADQRAAMGLIGFAGGGDAAAVPLADEVLLLLGPQVRSTSSADQLSDPDRWTIDEPDGFAEFAGPFTALSVLDRDDLRITAGPVPHCAGPPRDWPSELDGLRQVNIEPVGIDSCIAWFGVHLFLDDDDRIAAVAFDLFGP